MEIKYLYRFDDILKYHYSSVVENPVDYSVSLFLSKYSVIKKTPKGVRIDNYTEKGRFVNLSSKKKFACVTEKEALEQFLYRKKKQLGHLSAKIRQVEASIELAQQCLNGIARRNESMRIKSLRHL